MLSVYAIALQYNSLYGDSNYFQRPCIVNSKCTFA